MPREINPQHFRVEIEGVQAGTFTSVENLTAEVEVIEFKDGDDHVLRKRPGRTHYGDVTLKKGVLNNIALWEWWQAVSAGKLERKDVALILLNKDGKELLRWKLSGCWPRHWQFGATQQARGQDLMLEEITFVVEKIELGR